MTEKRAKRKLIKTASKNYRVIYLSSKLYCNEAHVKRVPLVVLNNLIDLATIDVNNPELHEALHEFAIRYNASLDILKQVCKNNSEMVGDRAISIKHVKQYIRELIKGLKKGAYQHEH